MNFNPETGEELKPHCTECGHRMPSNKQKYCRNCGKQTKYGNSTQNKELLGTFVSAAITLFLIICFLFIVDQC